MLRDHAVIVGYGRVGGRIGPMLEHAPYRTSSSSVIAGSSRAYVGGSVSRLWRCLARGNSRRGGRAPRPRDHDRNTGRPATRDDSRICARLNPRIRIAIGAHREAEIGALKREGADAVLIGEHELATAMAEYALTCAKTDIEHEDEPKESA